MFGTMSTILITFLILALAFPIALFVIEIVAFVCKIVTSNEDVEVVVRDYCSAVKRSFSRVGEAWKILRRK